MIGEEHICRISVGKRMAGRAMGTNFEMPVDKAWALEEGRNGEMSTIISDEHSVATYLDDSLRSQRQSTIMFSLLSLASCVSLP